MNPILEQLQLLTGRLDPTSGTPPTALASLRRLLAASLAQQNPGSLPVEPDPAVDSAINEAAVAGAALGAEMAQAGTRLRVIGDSYLSPAATPYRPARLFGPFVDGGGGLVQFAAFESARFLRVRLVVPAPFPHAVATLMLLPAGTTSDDGNRSFSIPAGTIWLGARFLVANTPGYVGLRIRGGTLELDRPALPTLGSGIGVPFNARWTLVLEPEQPAPAQAGGSDANGLSLQLPTRLVVHSTGAPEVSGALAMSGFGSDLEFADPAGGPIAGTATILFSYVATGASWSIDGNRSAAAEFAGACSVLSAAWSLPLIATLPDTLGEAAHGGSLTLRLVDRLESRLPGMSGVFRWFDIALSANGDGLELEARQAASSARLDLDLWTPARSDLAFAQEAIARLQFSSRRDGPDVALVGGGRIRNRWDLPLSAAGEPFPYEGAVEQFAVVAEQSGLLRIACFATQQPDARLHGVALENLYLIVRLPRRLAFTGDFDGAFRLSGGTALLFFDVTLAQPSLPDPYAANWPLPDEMFIAEDALSLALRWANGQTPAVEARLERSVRFPEPRDLPGDEDRTLRERFDRHLGSQVEVLSMLDLSSNDHHLGVALETFSDQQPRITQNRLAGELRHIRLLMQPQVQWEPVQVEPNPDAGTQFHDTVRSSTNGARTLAGTASVQLVPVLPGVVCTGIVAATRQGLRSAALFSLPFGLRAFARMDEIPERGAPFAIRPIETSLHEPDFGELTSARQLRLVATGSVPPRAPKDPARSMPGAMLQLDNLIPNLNKLGNVLGGGIDKFGNPIPGGVDTMMQEFREFLPLHHGDLSGYGLSTFSDWRRDVEVGVTQVRFDVLNGRTSYEVIQVRTVLAFCISHVVRTIIFERRNSGRVLRFDSGWQPVDDGLFKLKDGEFEKGVVKAFRNLRRIRVLAEPLLTLLDGSVWQKVLFDADADLEDVVAGGFSGLVPIRDHPGYVQLLPTGPGAEPGRARIVTLLQKIGAPVGGPIDCKIRVGGTLEMQLSGIVADDAPDDGGVSSALMVAAYGSPSLPRAGQWSAVRVNGATSEAAPADPRRGIPVIRRPGQPYTFRDPADAWLSKPSAEYGFLMSTQASRVLFPRPRVDPNQVGRLRTAEPMVADPYSLVQASSAFPRPSFALRCNGEAGFDISATNAWRLTNPDFSFSQPAPDLAKGGEWALERAFPSTPPLRVLVDSSVPAVPWDIAVPRDDLKLRIDPFPDALFIIRTNYHALSGALPKLEKPTLDFGPALSALKDVVDALKHFVDLGFDFSVDVTAGTGPSPSFLVRIELKFRIGKVTERIDIGVGKFYGEFLVRGELQAALSGATRGLLSAEFQGDVQQGILPPLLYAGGLFRFAIQVRETGRPLVELGLGVTASIGGDLIKGLVALEVTVKYGYTLIPETLQPAVLLGLDARAKLLSGLVGISFSTQAIARIQRVALDDKAVDIWAEIRVAATVQVAWLVEEDVDFRTQFQQRLPLAPVVAAQFMPALAPAAALL